MPADRAAWLMLVSGPALIVFSCIAWFGGQATYHEWRDRRSAIAETAAFLAALEQGDLNTARGHWSGGVYGYWIPKVDLTACKGVDRETDDRRIPIDYPYRGRLVTQVRFSRNCITNGAGATHDRLEIGADASGVIYLKLP